MKYTCAKLIIACLLSKDVLSVDNVSDEHGNLRLGEKKPCHDKMKDKMGDGAMAETVMEEMESAENELENEAQEIMSLIRGGVGNALSFIFEDPESLDESTSEDFFEQLEEDFASGNYVAFHKDSVSEDLEDEYDSEEEMVEEQTPFFSAFGGSFFDGSFIESMGSMFGKMSNSYTITTEQRGGSEEGPTTITKVEHVEKHDGQTDTTIETTKTYADGHSSHDEQKFVELDEDSSFEEIFDAYKDVINEAAPKLMDLTEVTGHKVGGLIERAVKEFWGNAFGVEDETIFKKCKMSKKQLIEDYEDFSEAYEELENVEDIKEDKALNDKFDKVANNFSRIMHIKN